MFIKASHQNSYHSSANCIPYFTILHPITLQNQKITILKTVRQSHIDSVMFLPSLKHLPRSKPVLLYVNMYKWMGAFIYLIRNFTHKERENCISISKIPFTCYIAKVDEQRISKRCKKINCDPFQPTEQSQAITHTLG